MRSSNPALSEKTFDNFARSGYFDQAMSSRMTVEGTVNKTGILLLLAVLSAAFTWGEVLNGNEGAAMALALGGALGGFIVALVTCFKPSASPYTAPIYAVLEGLVLGAFSSVLNRAYPGIVAQAVGLTFGVMAVMLIAYRSRLIQATEKFKIGIIAATGGIALFYLVLLVGRLFGAEFGAFMWNPTPLSIGISLVVVAIAALNLILDFDLIEQGARRGAPKFMEWYAAFGLLVTLVWLYLELLRLLAKLQSRD
jgi:uncharacterized YccA/Bax inhibitor family protein